MNIYELLVKSRDVFAERGGVKHCLSLRGNVCAVGAINVADHGSSEWRSNEESLDSVIEVCGLLNNQLANSDDGYSIVEFNNEMLTTKDDVLAVYDKAIAALEEKVE